MKNYSFGDMLAALVAGAMIGAAIGFYLLPQRKPANMADTVITFGNDTEGAEFILGDDGKLGVGAHLCGDGNMSYLSKDEARDIATQILAWAS